MYKKICTDCHQPSFSSCERGKWLCPVCGADISQVNHQNSENKGLTKKRMELISGYYLKKQTGAGSVNEFI